MAYGSADGKFTLGHFLYRVSIASMVGAAILGACNLSSQINPKLGVVCYGLALALVILITYLPLVLKIEDIRDSVKKSGGESDVATVLVGVVLSTVLFGLFCRELEVVWHARFDFVAGPENFWEWIGFSVDNLSEGIPFLDLVWIYLPNFADIEPASIWTKTLLLVFRLLIDVVILRGLYTIFTVVRENRIEEIKAASEKAELEASLSTGTEKHRDR
jgi:hypothetical protein